MIIPDTIKFASSAKEQWILKMVERDEASLLDPLPRPLPKYGKTPNPFRSVTSAYAFGAHIVKRGLSVLTP